MHFFFTTAHAASDEHELVICNRVNLLVPDSTVGKRDVEVSEEDTPVECTIPKSTLPGSGCGAAPMDREELPKQIIPQRPSLTR